MPHRYQHIIWDWNGTLLNDVSLTVDLINEQLTSLEISPISIETHREFLQFPLEQYYIRLGVDLKQKPFSEINREFHAQYKTQSLGCSLHPLAYQLLSDLKNAGITQSILSAHHQTGLDEQVDHFTVRHFFDCVSGLASSPGTSKIHNGHLLMQRLTIPKNQVLMVGDTSHDYEVAIALGIDCVLIAHGHQHRDILEKLDAHLTVLDSLHELRGKIFNV